ncbi:vacuolar protein sorting-associated protein Vps17 [Durotheca rogersii]|uniref:vacuolar protein sorting-associated protein Vps17 n=1 Tax=Durotheca rogersii TaxID=419775 RepID=UPI002220BA9A|nr:vacuolar protein sorting-associated protein Vps17 [Durotheca rogersii]KAI5868569.1 vacuolar protein sorting-associated protein Vps17 [Durotheca rogersii]
MDYRSPIADDDHPAAVSPWGSSPPASPRRNESTIHSLGSGHPPSSPYQYATQDSSNGFAHEDQGINAFRRPGTASSTTSTPAYDPSPQSEPSQQSSHGSEADQQHHHHQQGSPQQHPPHGRPPGEGSAAEPDLQPRRPAGPIFKLQAKITGLERTARKDPILRFDVHTNIPNFRTTQFRDVRRLHSEFVKLAEHLISANPDAIVPAVPPSVTSAGAGTDEDETRVKALMQRWFNYVCSNEVLMRDDEMVLFVESDFGYSPMVKKKQPATGVRRKLLKQFAPPPDDTPELSEARPIVKLFYLGSMDAGHKVDRLVKSRRGLGLAESDFGVKLGSMHVQEPHQGLANAYRKLGKIVQTVGDYHAAQATAEATTLSDPFQYHSQDAFIVKETLTNRQLLIREFLQAQEGTRSRRNAADRLKSASSVRPEKVDEALAALQEAAAAETELMQKTTRVSQNLVQERRRWFARTAADLRLSIREFVTREIEAERRALALLESARPDIRAIDASGGLSRLGREAHPTVRRPSLATSQGPKGDAWSGVPRRTDRSSMSGSFISSGGATAAATTPDDDDGDNGSQRPGSRPLSGSGSAGGLPGVAEEDDEDRVDARNAASRLATSTF